MLSESGLLYFNYNTTYRTVKYWYNSSPKAAIISRSKMVLSGAAVQRGQNGVTDPLIQEQTSECLKYSCESKHATIRHWWTQLQFKL